MAFSLGLLTKGLLGTSAVTAATVSIVFKDQIGERINDLFISKDRLNEKIKELGITETTCHFDDNLKPKTCTLDKTKLEKVKFEKTGSSFDSASASLTITKVTGVEAKDYTENLKFTFKNTNTGTSSTDLTLGSSGNTITLKKDVGYDFKIKTVGSESKLEKAWDLTSLAKKVGLGCADNNASSCTLPTTGVNVWKAEDDYITNATVTASSSMSVTKDTADYNQGFKFTVSSDITLTQGNKKKETNGIDKLTKTNKAYEIALKDDNGTKKWFLVEKDATASVPQESQ